MMWVTFYISLCALLLMSVINHIPKLIINLPFKLYVGTMQVRNLVIQLQIDANNREYSAYANKVCSLKDD